MSKMTLNEVRKQHGAGYDAGNAAIASLFDNDLQVGKVKNNEKALAGLLQSVLSFVYFSAPNVEAAEALIKFCKECAYDDVISDNKS